MCGIRYVNKSKVWQSNVVTLINFESHLLAFMIVYSMLLSVDFSSVLHKLISSWQTLYLHVFI